MSRRGIGALLVATAALSACASKPKSVYGTTDDREGIKKTVQAHFPELRRCYERALEQTPMLEGWLKLLFTFDDKGKVIDVQIKSVDPKLGPVAPCVVGRVKTWTFPPAAEGAFVDVAYPFYFSENGKAPSKSEEPEVREK